MKWRTLSSLYHIQNRWLTVRQDAVEQPSGQVIDDFYVLEYSDWVNVIAIDTEGRFIIEQQYRHGIGEVIYEICAGCVERGETPLQATKRELLEETGFGDGGWQQYMVSCPNTNSMNNRSYTYMATGVKPLRDPAPEATEDIRVIRMEKETVKRLLEQDQIPEGVMSAPLWRYFAEHR